MLFQTLLWGLKKKRGRKVRSIFEFQIGQSNKSTALTMIVKTYPSFSIHLKQKLGTILRTYSIIKSENAVYLDQDIFLSLILRKSQIN